MTISLSPRAVALKLLTAVPKNPSTKGTCLPPTFTHHSEYLITINLLLCFQTKLSLGLLAPSSGSYSFPSKCRLNSIVLRSLYLLTSCERGLQGYSSTEASIVGATRLDVLLVILHLCHIFSLDGWYTILFRRLPALEKNPCQGIPWPDLLAVPMCPCRGG